MKPEEILVERLFSKEKIRPELGDDVDIRTLQTMVALLSLSPGMGDLLFFGGKKVGMEYGKKVRGCSLEEGIEKYFDYLRRTKMAIPEIFELDSSTALIRLREKAEVYGLEAMGQKICRFDAGFQSGFLSQVTGKSFVSNETMCYANGDPYCEFEIRKITVPEAFEEAFKS